MLTEFQQEAYDLAICPAVRELPSEERWALQEALLDADEYEDLPEHIQVLFREDVFAPILEAHWLERLHPRGRAGRWKRSFRLDLPEIKQPAAAATKTKRPRVGRGRKAAVKGKATGWKGRIQELRREPPISVRKLKSQRVEAGRQRAVAWESIYGEGVTHITRNMEGETVEVRGEIVTGVQKGRFRLMHETGLDREGVERPGYALYIDGERRGWTAIEPHLSAENYISRIAPEEKPWYEKFMDEWWGSPGYTRGRYQTVSGDPGTVFQEQHARIMEAGAHLDAEVSRRIRPVLKEHLDMQKRLRAKQREVKRLRKEEEDTEYEAMRVRLAGWGPYPESITADEIRELHKKLERERNKTRRYRDDDFIRTYGHLWDEWQDRYNVEGVDVQAAYDRRIDAQIDRDNGEWALETEVKRTKLALQRARRDAFYEVLPEIREVGTGGSVQRLEFSGMSDAIEPVNQATRWLPSDWLRSSNEYHHRLTVATGSKRGFYRDQETTFDSLLALSGRDRATDVLGPYESVAIHELVHRAEYVHDGITAAEWTFYTSRVQPGINQKWEDMKKLRDVTQGGYDDDEMTRTDEFIDPYSGKSYGDNMDSSWEILTMGVQDLVSGEHGIIEGDEEYRHFVYGAMAML